MRNNCDSKNDLRVVDSVSDGNWLLQGDVGTEFLFSIPISLIRVFRVTVIRMSSPSFSNNMLLVETIWFPIFKIIGFTVPCNLLLINFACKI